MLIDALIKLLWFVMDIFLDVLPPWTVEIPTDVVQYLKYIRAFDAILPVTEFLQVMTACITLVFILLYVKLVIKAFDYIFDVIP